MAKAGVVFTKDNEYYTPSVFVERFGKFDYDPATQTMKPERSPLDSVLRTTTP